MVDNPKTYTSAETLALLDNARHLTIQQSVSGHLSPDERDQLSAKAETLSAEVETLTEEGIERMTLKMSDSGSYQEMNRSLQLTVETFNGSNPALVKFESVLHVADQAIALINLARGIVP